MGLLKKIGAALRGRQHEVLQDVVDGESIRILEQEIRDCQASMAKAKVELTRVVAESNACERELKSLDQQLEKLEQQAQYALAQDDQLQAEHTARQMADVEQASTEQMKQCQNMRSMETSLQDSLLQADRQIKQFVRELRLARASECAERGRSGWTRQNSKLGQQFQEVQRSLDRIKQRRQQADDLCAASRKVDQMMGVPVESSTDRRASEILANLKKAQAV